MMMNASEANYDLVLAGARICDPATGLDRNCDLAEAHQMTERTELLRFLNHREALRRFHDWRAGYIATHMRRRRAAVVRRCAITVLSMTALVLSCSLRGRRIAASFAKRESDA